MITTLYHYHEVLSFVFGKAKLVAEYFSENSNLEDSGNSLPAFSSWTNLKLHIIPVTPTLVKKVIVSLYSLKSSGADCIPVVVFKSSAWIFIHSSWAFTYVSEGILFSRLWTTSSVVIVVKNTGRGIRLETTAQVVVFLWLVESLKNL